MKFMPYKILSVVLVSLMIGGEPVKGGSGLSKILGGASKVTEEGAADASGIATTAAAKAAQAAQRAAGLRNLRQINTNFAFSYLHNASDPTLISGLKNIANTTAPAADKIKSIMFWTKKLSWWRKLPPEDKNTIEAWIQEGQGDVYFITPTSGGARDVV